MPLIVPISETQTVKLLTVPDVLKRVPFCMRTLLSRMHAGKFPMGHKLDETVERSVLVWREPVIDQYVAEHVEAMAAE
jgi:predicted DNA-binding transcriptional regulator AlpA